MHEGAAKKRREPSTPLSQQVTTQDDFPSLQHPLFDTAQRIHREPRQMTPREVMRLQRSIGNQAAIRLLNPSPDRQPSLQRTVYDDIDTMWGKVVPDMKLAHIDNIVFREPELVMAYRDMSLYIKKMDFQYVKNKQPEAKVNPGQKGTYEILYGKPEEQEKEFLRTPSRFVAYILHEMMHVTAALQYATNVPAQNGNVEHMVNMNLPTPIGTVGRDGLAKNQIEDIGNQLDMMRANWDQLLQISKKDKKLSPEQQEVIQARVGYAGDAAHYDTVLVDLLFYLVSQGGDVKQSESYQFARRMLEEANLRRRKATGKVPNLAQ
jgi:hypothetical protein